ncbi:hypothetical protein BKA93DRAFT_914146 [Sparassis latifolia]
MASARSDDTSSMKTAIVVWLRKDIAASGKDIHPKRKPGRGFNHPVTGALLCPAALDYMDAGVQQALKEHTATINGRLIDGTDWPAFIYSGTYNPDLPWVGMLRGPLLVRTFIHIFLSPSLANSDDEDLHDENLDAGSPNRSTRSGNADLNGMTAVTPHSIAYCACQLMFALCSATVFNKFSKDHHCIGFYRSVCAFFADPEFHEEVADLLRWWNRRVFPESHGPVQHTGNYHLENLKRAKAANATPVSASASPPAPASVSAFGAIPIQSAAAPPHSPSTLERDMANLERLSAAAADARAVLAAAEAAQTAAEARSAQAAGGQ